MTPIATIVLDYPNASGEVRGVICWDRDAQVIRVLDPLGEARVPEDCAEGSVTDIDDALDYIDASWGRNGAWELYWLVTDPTDYAAASTGGAR